MGAASLVFTMGKWYWHLLGKEGPGDGPDSLQFIGQSYKTKMSCILYCCSVAQLCPILCEPRDRSTPGFPVLHYRPEFAQSHVHRVGDAIQPSHPLSSPHPPALNLSQHQGLLQWVGSSHQVTKVLEFQLQSFQWIFRVGFLNDWLVWSFDRLAVQGTLKSLLNTTVWKH